MEGNLQLVLHLPVASLNYFLDELKYLAFFFFSQTFKCLLGYLGIAHAFVMCVLTSQFIWCSCCLWMLLEKCESDYCPNCPTECYTTFINLYKFHDLLYKNRTSTLVKKLIKFISRCPKSNQLTKLGKAHLLKLALFVCLFSQYNAGV